MFSSSDDGRSLLDVIWPAVVGGGGTAPYATHAGDSSAHPSLYTPLMLCKCIMLHFAAAPPAEQKKGRAQHVYTQQRESLLMALSFVIPLLLAFSCYVTTDTGCSNVSPGHIVGGGTPSSLPPPVVYLTLRSMHIAKRGGTCVFSIVEALY